MKAAKFSKSKWSGTDQMTQNKFGGNWTEEKLTCLHDYLTNYRIIFSQNKASYYLTWYVDAFAGTGSRLAGVRDAEGFLFPEINEEKESTRYRKGSALRALSLESPFDRYLFIEAKKSRVRELKKNITENFPKLLERCLFETGDANERIKQWCGLRDWQKERAVVFLDPYGMQVHWQTIETLAATKGVDLWYLFPLATRLLRNDGNLDDAWRSCLTRLFGTENWRSRFYQPSQNTNLFPDVELMQRDASVENIRKFIEERLKSCFAGVAPGLVLSSSKSPLYLLCFAAANEKGAPIAIRIASSILGARRVSPKSRRGR